MVIGASLTPFSARIVERVGPRVPIVGGLCLMTAGAVALSAMPASTPIWVLSVLMVPIGLGGPLIAPPVTAVLLSSVPGRLAGTVSGVFNTSRQMGGALAIAVFGALLADPATFTDGLRASLVIAAAVAFVAAASSLFLSPQ
jgi:MFS transporter, DHA2 family, methylenomycin A resistance protein